MAFTCTEYAVMHLGVTNKNFSCNWGVCQSEMKDKESRPVYINQLQDYYVPPICNSCEKRQICSYDVLGEALSAEKEKY